MATFVECRAAKAKVMEMKEEKVTLKKCKDCAHCDDEPPVCQNCGNYRNWTPKTAPPPPSRFTEVPVLITFGKAGWDVPVGERVGFRYACCTDIIDPTGPVNWWNGHVLTGHVDTASKSYRGRPWRMVVATHAIYTVLTTKDQEGREMTLEYIKE